MSKSRMLAFLQISNVGERLPQLRLIDGYHLFGPMRTVSDMHC